MITRLEIEGFRGVRGPAAFVPGRITVLTGRNGLGKTTFFDAIDWCLFGPGWRLGEDSDAVENLYASTMRPRVAVHVSGPTGNDVLIRTDLAVTLNGHSLSDRELLEHFITDLDILPNRDIATSFRRLVYLPQADIRGFVAPSTESERAALLHSLLGVPGAGVVESSIRRVNERLSERRRTLITDMESATHDIENATESLPPAGALRDERTTVDQARLFLGASAAAVDSLPGLLALSQERLTSLLERRDALVALLTFSGKISATRTDVRTRLASEETRYAECERERAAVEDDRVQTTNLLTASRQKWREADEVVRAAETQLSEARLAVSRQRLASDARSESEAASEDARALAGRIEAARSLIDTTSASLTPLADRIFELEAARVELVQRLASVQNRQRLRQDLARVESEVEAVASRDQTTGSVVIRLAQETGAQQRLVAEADAQYSQAVEQLSRTQRLGELVFEISEVVRELPGADCPVCGAAYLTRDALVARIEIALGRQSRSPEAEVELARIAREQSVATLEDTQQRLQVAERELTEIRRQQAGLEDRRSRLLSELGEATDDEAPGHIETVLQEAQDSITSAQIERTRIEVALAAAKTNYAELARAGHAAEERRDRATHKHETTVIELGDYATTTPDELSALIEHLEAAYRDAVAIRQGILEEGRRLSASQESLGTRLAALETEKSATQKQIAEMRRTLASIQNDEWALRQRAGVSLDVSEAQMQQALEVATAAIAESERVSASLQSLVGDVRRRELEQVIARTKTSVGRLRSDLAELDRAQTRFAEISTAVQQRANAEAQAAASAQQSAIQDCLKMLSPYRHLDRISIAPSVGDILVSDRYVNRPVRPDVYSSTGQMNVLALSVFLGVALRQRVTTLGTLLLDEPIQNLDDLHFLAFTSLVKRVALTRQIIFSTADSNVAEVFRRQVRSTWAKDQGDYVEYHWESFDPGRGPVVRRREIPEPKRGVVSDRVA